ncbi:MAG: glycoside hydrolase family 15 protein [Acidobacteria bacterium]|nr:glycoside hydrolase family 15 protein [Acidobacteriota bacterium]
MAYKPIEHYGLIGDMHTAALVGLDGSIDWLCLPSFDSPSVFAAILDHQKGGFFSVAPEDSEVSCKQFYWSHTNVLVSRFMTAHGAAELTDFMPVGTVYPAPRHHDLVRRVTAVRGCLPIRVICRPAFDYARADHHVEATPNGVRFVSPRMTLALVSDNVLRIEGKAAVAHFDLDEGESAHFILRMEDDEPSAGLTPSARQIEASFEQTVHFWRAWIGRSQYGGRWREMVERSLLTLKLLTYEPTGAIVAAPTTSLPESVGGVRNWDYRYTWVRDAAFTLYALLRLGYHEEAHRYFLFLRGVSQQQDGAALQVLYGVDGRRSLEEHTLDHLEGYKGSRPVRIGNGAVQQMQLDIYGELIDSIYLYNKWGNPISHDDWLSVGRLVEWVLANWQSADSGMWEVRADPRHYVSSKAMCWVAVDRALRIAEQRSLPCDVSRWVRGRDEMYRDIMTKGWSETRKSFVMHYGGTALDASALLMPLTLFIAPNDPRMLSTLDALMRPPKEGGLLLDNQVRRYHLDEAPDGLPGSEGTFNMCTFWLVEALTRAGRFQPALLERARLLFERMLGYSNHLGLFAEEVGSRGEALGNFPQAFTHLALISAAYNLDRTLDLGTERHPPSHR